MFRVSLLLKRWRALIGLIIGLFFFLPPWQWSVGYNHPGHNIKLPGASQSDHRSSRQWSPDSSAAVSYTKGKCAWARRHSDAETRLTSLDVVTSHGSLNGDLATWISMWLFVLSHSLGHWPVCITEASGPFLKLSHERPRCLQQIGLHVLKDDRAGEFSQEARAARTPRMQQLSLSGGQFESWLAQASSQQWVWLPLESRRKHHGRSSTGVKPAADRMGRVGPGPPSQPWSPTTALLWGYFLPLVDLSFFICKLGMMPSTQS